MVRRSNWTFARWGVAFLVGTAAVLILSHCLSSPAAGGGVEGSGGVAFEMASVRSTAPLTFTPVFYLVYPYGDSSTAQRKWVPDR